MNFSDGLQYAFFLQIIAVVVWAIRNESKLKHVAEKQNELDKSYKDELDDLKSITGNLLEAIHSLEKTVCVLNDRQSRRSRAAKA